MYENKLPFGAKVSPTIFHRLTQAIRRTMKRINYKVIFYQDDFLVGGKSYESCHAAWVALQELLKKLGFELNMDKLVSPSTCFTFLGIEIDSVRMEVSLPQEKVIDIQKVVEDCLNKK